MDQSQAVNPTPAVSPIPAGSTPAQPAQSVNVSGNGGGNKKMIIMVIVLIIVLAALVGGGYYYFTMMQNPATPVSTPVQKTTQKSTAVEPTPEEELNAILIDDGNSDFMAIDQDLQTL